MRARTDENQTGLASGPLIEALRSSETYQNYERAYTETTGMPIALRSVETWQLLFHGQRKESAFCAVMAEKSRTCAACLRLQERLAQDAMHKPATRTCAYGLCETAAPLKLGLRTIGYLQTGQVMRQEPTETSFQHAVDQARKLGVDIDNEQVRRAFFATPIASPRKLEAVENLLALFAEHLAMKGNQIFVQTENAEPPIISKAKAIIRERYTENLSLSLIASTVNTSPFHFCKLFSKCTGVSFTEFVSRTRVEKAMSLLLNPNLRISEIAFAVGYQSITNFNRMFQRILGQSPTGYRDKLPRVPDLKPVATLSSAFAMKPGKGALKIHLAGVPLLEKRRLEPNGFPVRARITAPAG